MSRFRTSTRPAAAILIVAASFILLPASSLAQAADVEAASALELATDQAKVGPLDPAFVADLEIVRELLLNHRAITRTVVHMANGVCTVTASTSPVVARALLQHVSSMEDRLLEGDAFNLNSPTLPKIFDNYPKIHTKVVYDATSVTVSQISDDPELVAALQAHAAEVTEFVDEGMIALMRSMAGGEHGAASATRSTPEAVSGEGGASVDRCARM